MDIADEAVDLANAVEAVCDGHTTAAIYLALGMVLGRAEARAPRSDLSRLMGIIRKVAEQQMNNVQ